jgi:hypothetical protein
MGCWLRALRQGVKRLDELREASRVLSCLLDVQIIREPCSVTGLERAAQAPLQCAFGV